MAQNCFHQREGGRNTAPRNLVQFLDYAKKSGCRALPSNYAPRRQRLQDCEEIKDIFAKAKMSLDGVSAHCPFWVHHRVDRQPDHSAFLPSDVAKKSPADIEAWARAPLRLLDLCGHGVKIIPMFWGVAFGWELATGYPWGFWKGAITICSRKDRTASSRRPAKSARTRKLGQFLAHGFIRHGVCRRFQHACAHLWRRQSRVNADRRIGKVKTGNALPQVGPRVYACHVKFRDPLRPAVAHDGTTGRTARCSSWTFGPAI
jgi:hypothetical protein